MHEKQLAAVCAAAAVAGILLIAAYSKALAAQPMGIAEISGADIGKALKVKGALASIYSRNGNWFISVCNKGCIKAFIPASVARGMPGKGTDLKALRKGAWISFSGAVQEYKGALEIAAYDEYCVEVHRP
ncbi:MAG: hypothetical protein V1787_00690 [Candidatus Micrarchaeota archaeon]